MTSGSRTCGRCRRRAGPATSGGSCTLIASGSQSGGSPRSVRLLWAIRWKVGALLGWDRQEAAAGTALVRDRLPPDLRAAPSGPDFEALPFSSIYLLDDEWAAEIVNRTVHGVLHVGWVPDGNGGYRGQLAVYVRPNGLLGRSYLAAITPIRRLVVYPQMLERIGRAWQAGR